MKGQVAILGFVMLILITMTVTGILSDYIMQQKDLVVEKIEALHIADTVEIAKGLLAQERLAAVEELTHLLGSMGGFEKARSDCGEYADPSQDRLVFEDRIPYWKNYTKICLPDDEKLRILLEFLLNKFKVEADIKAIEIIREYTESQGVTTQLWPVFKAEVVGFGDNSVGIAFIPKPTETVKDPRDIIKFQATKDSATILGKYKYFGSTLVYEAFPDDFSVFKSKGKNLVEDNEIENWLKDLLEEHAKFDINISLPVETFVSPGDYPNLAIEFVKRDGCVFFAHEACLLENFFGNLSGLPEPLEGEKCDIDSYLADPPSSYLKACAPDEYGDCQNREFQGHTQEEFEKYCYCYKCRNLNENPCVNLTLDETESEYNVCNLCFEHASANIIHTGWLSGDPRWKYIREYRWDKLQDEAGCISINDFCGGDADCCTNYCDSGDNKCKCKTENTLCAGNIECCSGFFCDFSDPPHVCKDLEDYKDVKIAFQNNTCWLLNQDSLRNQIKDFVAENLKSYEENLTQRDKHLGINWRFELLDAELKLESGGLEDFFYNISCADCEPLNLFGCKDFLPDVNLTIIEPGSYLSPDEYPYANILLRNIGNTAEFNIRIETNITPDEVFPPIQEDCTPSNENPLENTTIFSGPDTAFVAGSSRNVFVQEDYIHDATIPIQGFWFRNPAGMEWTWSGSWTKGTYNITSCVYLEDGGELDLFDNCFVKTFGTLSCGPLRDQVRFCCIEKDSDSVYYGSGGIPGTYWDGDCDVAGEANNPGYCGRWKSSKFYLDSDTNGFGIVNAFEDNCCGDDNSGLGPLSQKSPKLVFSNTDIANINKINDSDLNTYFSVVGENSYVYFDTNRHEDEIDSNLITKIYAKWDTYPSSLKIQMLRDYDLHKRDIVDYKYRKEIIYSNPSLEFSRYDFVDFNFQTKPIVKDMNSDGDYNDGGIDKVSIRIVRENEDGIQEVPFLIESSQVSGNLLESATILFDINIDGTKQGKPGETTYWMYYDDEEHVYPSYNFLESAFSVNPLLYSLYENLNAKLLENSENVFKWDVYLGTGTVDSVYDEYMEDDVIELSGGGLNTGYIIGDTDADMNANDQPWNKNMKIIRWKSNFTEDFNVYVAVDTNKGERFLEYTSGNINKGFDSLKNINHGLGYIVPEGPWVKSKWHTITRNLETDLKDGEPDNELISVNALLVKGSGKIDDITLLSPVIGIDSEKDSDNNGIIDSIKESSGFDFEHSNDPKSGLKSQKMKADWSDPGDESSWIKSDLSIGLNKFPYIDFWYKINEEEKEYDKNSKIKFYYKYDINGVEYENYFNVSTGFEETKREVWGRTSSLYGLDVDYDGYIYITDYDSELVKLNPETKKVVKDGGGNLREDVTVAPQGYLFLLGYTSTNERTVSRRINSAWGSRWFYLNKWAESLISYLNEDSNYAVHFHSIDSDSDYVYATYDHTTVGNGYLIRYDHDLSIIDTYGPLGDSPLGVAAAGNGKVFVSDTSNNRIIKLDESLDLVEEYTGITPYRMDVGLDGFLYVIEGGNRLLKFDLDLNYVSEFNNLGSVKDVAVDRFGNIYYISGYDKIRKIHSDSWAHFTANLYDFAEEPIDLISYWKFDEGSGTSAKDGVGNNHGTVYGATWSSGKYGNALSFDGVDDYVSISDSGTSPLDFPNAWTLSAWVFVNPTETDYGHVISKRGGASDEANYAFRTNGNGIGWDCYFKRGGVWYGAWGKGTVHKDEWHHMVCVYDGIDTIRIYEDGQEIGSANVGSPPSTNNEDVVIGAFASGVEALDGIIDEVRVYDKVLPEYEIKGFLKNITLNEIKFIVDDIDSRETGTTNFYLDDVMFLQTDPELVELTPSISEEQKQEYWRDKNGIWVDVGVPKGISYWKFDESSGSRANDETEKNPGTVYGATWTTGKYGNALSFDGVDDYVEVPNSASISPTNAITIAFWAYLEGGSQTAIRKNVNDYLFEFGTDGTNTPGTNPQWFVKNSGGFYKIYGAGDYTNLNLNQWYHMVGTYDGTEAKMYINGQEATVTVGNSNIGTIASSGSYLRIGNWGSEIFKGKIDDVHIYDRALTPEEIQEIYSSPPEEESIYSHTNDGTWDIYEFPYLRTRYFRFYLPETEDTKLYEVKYDAEALDTWCSDNGACDNGNWVTESDDSRVFCETCNKHVWSLTSIFGGYVPTVVGNIVNNPGAEDDLDGWTAGGWIVVTDSTTCGTGSNKCFASPPSAPAGYIEQTFSPPAIHYGTLIFWQRVGCGDVANDLKVTVTYGDGSVTEAYYSQVAAYTQRSMSLDVNKKISKIRFETIHQCRFPTIIDDIELSGLGSLASTGPCCGDDTNERWVDEDNIGMCYDGVWHPEWYFDGCYDIDNLDCAEGICLEEGHTWVQSGADGYKCCGDDTGERWLDGDSIGMCHDSLWHPDWQFSGCIDINNQDCIQGFCQSQANIWVQSGADGKRCCGDDLLDDDWASPDGVCYDGVWHDDWVCIPGSCDVNNNYCTSTGSWDCVIGQCGANCCPGTVDVDCTDKYYAYILCQYRRDGAFCPSGQPYCYPTYVSTSGAVCWECGGCHQYTGLTHPDGHSCCSWCSPDPGRWWPRCGYCGWYQCSESCSASHQCDYSHPSGWRIDNLATGCV